VNTELDELRQHKQQSEASISQLSSSLDEKTALIASKE
jgi:hypothetical protein